MSSKCGSPTAAGCWNINGLALGVYDKKSHLSGCVNLNCLELCLTADNSHAEVAFNDPGGYLQVCRNYKGLKHSSKFQKPDLFLTPASNF